jgi:hypothetical protein
MGFTTVPEKQFKQFNLSRKNSSLIDPKEIPKMDNNT